MAKRLAKRTKPKVDVTLKEGKSEETSVKGTPQELEDQVAFTTIPKGKKLIGLSKGVTINLGDFQSARINCIVMSLVDEDRSSVQNELIELSSRSEERRVGKECRSRWSPY